MKMNNEEQVKAESIIMNGDPREMICQAAEEMHVDLLVMGSRGLGTFRRSHFSHSQSRLHFHFIFFFFLLSKYL